MEQKILLTGASGRIAARLRPLLLARYGALTLTDLRPPDALAAGETFTAADLADFSAVRAAVTGADAIIHLGGISGEAAWPDILQANIIGSYNLYEAARQAGVRRIIYASSNHAVGFYPRSQTIGADVTPLPDTRYGLSKVFGEGLAALYAYKHGLASFVIRIGNLNETPIDRRRLSIWISPEDLAQLVAIGLEQPDLHFEVVYGASDNARAWWRNDRAEALGYRPAGKSEAYAEAAEGQDPPPPAMTISEFFQGGTFCADEFDADPARWLGPKT